MPTREMVLMSIPTATWTTKRLRATSSIMAGTHIMGMRRRGLGSKTQASRWVESCFMCCVMSDGSLDEMVLIFLNGLALIFLNGLVLIFLNGLALTFLNGLAFIFLNGLALIFSNGLAFIFLNGLVLILLNSRTAIGGGWGAMAAKGRHRSKGGCFEPIGILLCARQCIH